MKTLDEDYTIIEGLGECANDSPLLETYGEDLETIKKQYKDNPKKVWTVLDNGEEKDGFEHLYVVAGFHFVNRLNYLITKEEWKDEEEVYVY